MVVQTFDIIKEWIAMRRNKGFLYFGIASIYVFFSFVLFSRLLFATDSFAYYGEWLMSEPFLVKVSLWSPLVIGIVFLCVYVYRRGRERDEKKRETEKGKRENAPR